MTVGDARTRASGERSRRSAIPRNFKGFLDVFLCRKRGARHGRDSQKSRAAPPGIPGHRTTSACRERRPTISLGGKVVFGNRSRPPSTLLRRAGGERVWTGRSRLDRDIVRQPHPNVSHSTWIVELPRSDTALYRADIDGLRAVSILAVVAYHAGPRLVPGGFIGVDI